MIDTSKLPPIPGEDVDLSDLEEEEGEAVGSIDDEEVEAAPVVSDEGDETEEPEEEEDAPDLDAVSEKARQWDNFAQHFSQNPAQMISTLYKNMSAEEQAQFLAATGAKADAPEAEPEVEYEPQSDIESLYLKERKQYAADRKALADIPKFAQTVHEEFSVRDQFINDVSISNAILEHKLNAVLELLDAKLPDADLSAIQKALLSGKTTYSDAVAKHYKPALEKAVKVEKQAKKVRPRTPANTSNSSVDLSREKDMVKLFRLIGS